MTNLAPNIPTLADFGPTLVNADVVEDPQTDLDATTVNALRVQAAAMALVAPKAVLYFTVSGGVTTLVWYRSQYGDDVTKWPTLVRTDVGRFSLTWAASYSNLEDTPQDVAWGHSLALVSQDTDDPLYCHVQKPSPTALLLRFALIESPTDDVDPNGVLVVVY